MSSNSKRHRLVGPIAAVETGRGSDEDRTVRIALVADPHSTRATRGDAANYKERFKRVIADVNATGVAFVVIAGDLTNGGRVEQMRDFKAQIKSFQAPVVYVAGNRDVGNRVGLGDTFSEERVVVFERELRPSFFASQIAGVRVVGVNASLFGSGLKRESDQWAFLDKALAGPSPTRTLLLLHYPPFLRRADEDDQPRWNLPPEARARLFKLISQGGVLAVLSGHVHRPIRNRYEDVWYITAPATSYGTLRNRRRIGWTLLTVSPKGGIRTQVHYVDSRTSGQIR